MYVRGAAEQTLGNVTLWPTESVSGRARKADLRRRCALPEFQRPGSAGNRDLTIAVDRCEASRDCARLRSQLIVDSASYGDEYMPFRHCPEDGREPNRVCSNAQMNGDYEQVHANLRFAMKREAIAARLRLEEVFLEQSRLTRGRRHETFESLARKASDRTAITIAYQDVLVENVAVFDSGHRL